MTFGQGISIFVTTTTTTIAAATTTITSITTITTIEILALSPWGRNTEIPSNYHPGLKLFGIFLKSHMGKLGCASLIIVTPIPAPEKKQKRFLGG